MEKVLMGLGRNKAPTWNETVLVEVIPGKEN
jgi:hypothetical protein